MKKEYRFATVDFADADLICPICRRKLGELEYVVRMPINNNLTWICAGCAANEAIKSGMERFEQHPTHFVSFGERKIAAFDAENVGILKGLIAK